MRFLMLMIPAVYQPGAEVDARSRAGVPDPEKVAAMMKLNEDLNAAGALIALDGLHPPSKGARIGFRGGKPITDGPFAESKEVVGGYWILNCASEAEALAWARRVPADDGDVIEVRRIQEMADFPAEVVEAARSAGPEVTRAMEQPRA